MFPIACIHQGVLSRSAGAVPFASLGPFLDNSSPVVGDTIGISTVTWQNSPTSHAYQWLRDGVEIMGATGATYVATEDDIGSALSVRDTATNAAGSGSATSDESDPVQISAFDPSSYANVLRWWNPESLALSDGAPVGAYTDSVSGDTATQTGSARPTFTAVAKNGLPAITCNGSQFMVGGTNLGISGDQERHVFAVVKATGATGSIVDWGDDDDNKRNTVLKFSGDLYVARFGGGANDWLTGLSIGTGWVLLYYSHIFGVSGMSLNGAAPVNQSHVSATVNSPVYIGASAGDSAAPMDGLLGDIIIADSATDAVRLIFDLNARWGLGLSLSVSSILQTTSDALFTLNSITFADTSKPAYRVASGYNQCWVPDSMLQCMDRPEKFTDTITGTIIDHAYALKDGSDNFPLAIASDGVTAPYYSSGCLLLPTRNTADGLWGLIYLHAHYYGLTVSLSKFNAQKAVLKVQLALIPLDGVYVDATGWIPWGFEDGCLSTGKHLHGTIFHWQAMAQMADLCAAAGDTADAITYSAAAATILAAMQNTSGPLWDAANGMFLCASVDNNQIDITGSCYAVFLGLASSTQAEAIADYIHANFSSIVNSRGYVRQSPSNWAHSTGGNQCSRGTGNYCDGYWSQANLAICETLLPYHPNDAVTICRRFAGYCLTALPSEYFGVSDTGVANDLTVGNGCYAFARAHPELF